MRRACKNRKEEDGKDAISKLIPTIRKMKNIGCI